MQNNTRLDWMKRQGDQPAVLMAFTFVRHLAMWQGARVYATNLGWRLIPVEDHALKLPSLITHVRRSSLDNSLSDGRMK
ncbi:hypothetical protein J6590_016879 [Homalodisca vitripennis]|nr:hypothetical protein J6590_016879 [Homalodisca vitripennis]